MSKKMSKVAASNAKVEEAVKVQEKKDFMSFYNASTKEKLMPILRITDHTGQNVVCELEFSSIMKWNKDANKAEWSYVNMRISKPTTEGGELDEVLKLTFGHSDKKNMIWVMKNKPEQEAKPITVENV